VAAACTTWTQVEQLVTLNASRGGVFLRAQKSPPVGTPMRLAVSLPNGMNLSLDCAVVHVITPEEAAESGLTAGFGVKFLQAHEGDLVLLEAMARAEAAAAAAPDTAAAGPESAESQPVAEPRLASAEGRQTYLKVTSVARAVAIARISSKTDAEELTDVPATSNVVFGIDYGTTYSSIAVVHDGKAFVIPDASGRALIPSIVSYPETGGILVGWEARERVATDPGRTIYSAKRLLGRLATEDQVANQLAQQACRTVAGPGGQVVYDLGRSPISVPQVAAEVLRLLRRTAERVLGLEVAEIVMSAPVTFGAAQRNALRKAAELAGLRVVGIIDEPAAAGLVYGFGRGKNELAAIYDFSGGTFDFTVLELAGSTFRIRAQAGDSWLGGDDFDHALAKDLANQFWRLHKIELQQRVVEWQRVIWACEEAKRHLTDSPAAVVDLDHLARNAHGPIGLRAEVTRAHFEGHCKELVGRSMAIVEQALAEAKVAVSDIGQVVVTGGCTRIPMVRAEVSRFFGRELGTLVHPDQAVALGAAIQAALLARKAAQTVPPK
jgi:molecular chaperone DnaK (HSP70)